MTATQFLFNILLHAAALSGIAERQQGQDLQRDARLAVAGCLCSAELRVSRNLPFAPGPQQYIMLVASCVHFAIASAPGAASAASVCPSAYLCLP